MEQNSAQAASQQPATNTDSQLVKTGNNKTPLIVVAVVLVILVGVAGVFFTRTTSQPTPSVTTPQKEAAKPLQLQTFQVDEGDSAFEDATADVILSRKDAELDQSMQRTTDDMEFLDTLSTIFNQ